MKNKATQTLDLQVVNRVAALEKQMVDLKTKQAIGGDAINYATASGSATFTIIPGAYHVHTLTVTAAVARMYVATLQFDFYVNNDGNPAYLWSDGSSIVPSQLWPIRRDFSEASLHSSEEFDGKKVFLLTFENFSNASGLTPATYTIYLHYKVIIPSQDLGVS